MNAPGYAASAFSQVGQEVGPPGYAASPVDVHQPGGALLTQLLHPSITIWEQMFRISPSDAWFLPTVNAANPVQFELGSYRVPSGQHLWLRGYEFSVYRQSGVDSGDFLKAEGDRFSGMIGFDLTVNGTRPASIKFQLEPTPASVGNSAFTGACAGSASQPFALAKPTGGSFKMGSPVLKYGILGTGGSCVNLSGGQGSSVASQGTSLLPSRPERMGPLAPDPFTIVVKENQSLVLTCVIYRAIRSPIAFIQADAKGYLVQTNASEALMNRVRPR